MEEAGFTRDFFSQFKEFDYSEPPRVRRLRQFELENAESGPLMADLVLANDAPR